jgi:hypothetical protein
LEAEDNTAEAVAAIKKLELNANKSQHSPPSSSVKTSSLAWPTLPQLAVLKEDLMSSVLELCTCRQIVSTAPTLNELLNPIEQQEIGDSPL